MWEVNGGLMLSGSGSADLGQYNGALSVDNTISGMSGTSLTVASLLVGNTGTGSFAQSAGTVTCSLNVGYQPGASGTYNLNGGCLNAYYEQIGTSGTGTFTQSDGSNTTSWLTIGSWDWDWQDRGTYNLNGGSLYAESEEITNGTFTQSAGTKYGFA
jgi:hypothetical protein